MKVLFVVLVIILSVDSFNFKAIFSDVRKHRLTKSVAIIVISSGLVIGTQSPLTTANSVELPSLDKCFDVVRKELDSKEGESIIHIKTDIDEGKWDDLKLFSREYDTNFRGGILKSAWKQLGDNQQKGIRVTNSFTTDLIALNKAAKTQDKDDAYHQLDKITKDLKDFLALEQLSWIRTKPPLVIKEGPVP
jgi:hypothetical protein